MTDMGVELERMALAPHVTETFLTGSRGSTIVTLNHKPERWSGRLSPFTALRIGRQAIRAEWDLEGERVSERVIGVGELTLLPPNAGFCGTLSSAAPVDYVALSPEAVERALQDVAPEFVGDFGALYACPFRSCVLNTIGRRLIEEAEAGNPHGPLYADTLVHTMVTELHSLAKLGPPKAPLPDLTLSADVLERIDAFVDETSVARVHLEDLARLAGLPAARFSRSLKAQTGLSPYQYVLNRRLIRARDLIESTGLSLAEIAYRCGFASQSHMTDVFSSKLGATPGAIRKALRSGPFISG